VRSPRLAAIGVATLSGFTLHFLDNSTTPTIIAPANRKLGVINSLLEFDIYEVGSCII